MFLWLGWAESLFLLLILSLILSASFGCRFFCSASIFLHPNLLDNIPHVCGKKTSGTKRPNYVLWVLVAATFFPFRSFSLGNSSRFPTAGIIWPETRNHRPKSSDETQWFQGTLQVGAIPAPFSDLPCGNLTVRY